MNIGIFIHESYEEFDIENCITELNQNLLNTPLPADYQLFCIFENSAALVESQQAIPLFDLHNHPTIDVMVVVQQSFYKHTPNTKIVHWLQAKAQSAQLLIALFAGCKLLDELNIFTDLKMLKTGSKPLKLEVRPKAVQSSNRRWQSYLVVYVRQSLVEAILSSLYLFHRLENTDLVGRQGKQLQFDL